MSDPIQLRGIPRQSWSEWQCPDAIIRKDVPNVPGIYMLRAVDKNGDPAELIWTSDPTAPCHANAGQRKDFDGVLYIGLAGQDKPKGKTAKKEHPSTATLKTRFVDRLVATWKSQARRPSSGWAHKSREHYESDQLDQRYPVQQMQVRYMALLPTAWLRQIDSSVQALVDVFDWDTANQYVEYYEARLMADFKRIFGHIPLLNRDDETKKLGSPMSDAELDRWLAGIPQATNPVLHLGDDEIYVFWPSSGLDKLLEALQTAGISYSVQADTVECSDVDEDTLHQFRETGLLPSISSEHATSASDATVVFALNGESPEALMCRLDGCLTTMLTVETLDEEQ